MVKSEFGQCGLWTLNLTVSGECTDRITDILHVDSGSQKLKPHPKFFRWAWSKMGVEIMVVGL